MDGGAADPDTAGWTLVQLSELIRRAEELLLDGVTLVGPDAHAAMGANATLSLSAADVRRIGAALVEGVEIAEQIELLAARLPKAALTASYADVSAAAAADLAQGIVDPRRVMLAARLLDVATGWPALAEGLSANDSAAAWEELTLDDLLCRFRDADRAVVAQLVRAAGLTPRARWAACPPERLALLAAGLRRHASGQPAP